MKSPLMQGTIPLCLTVAWGFGLQGAASGQQQVKLVLPEDDPSPNSAVVSSVAFSPDGKLVATGHGRFLGMLQESRPGQTILWDAVTGKRMRAIPALIDGVRSVSFSPDGKSLAVLEYPGIVRLFTVPEGRELRKIETGRNDRGFLSVAFFPDGKRLAAGVGGEIGVPESDIQIRNVENGRLVRVLNGHSGPVASLAVSADGQRLVSGAWDGTARIWDIANGRSLKTLSFPSPAMKPKEKLEEGEEPWVQSVSFSPDGRIIATAAGSIGFPGEVDVWETSTGAFKATLKGNGPSVYQVAFSPDGKTLAAADRQGAIMLWNATTFQEVGRLQGFPPIAFSPDGKSLAFGAGERTVVVGKRPDESRR